MDLKNEKNRWMVGWIQKRKNLLIYAKNMDGWMDKKKLKKMDGWMDG